MLARPCAYPEEWLHLCAAVAAAEAAASRGEWLLRRLPGAPQTAEALLRDSLGGGAGACGARCPDCGL